MHGLETMIKEIETNTLCLPDGFGKWTVSEREKDSLVVRVGCGMAVVR